MTNPEKIKKLSIEELTNLIKSSSSLQEILDKLEIKKDQRCKELIKAFAHEHNISLYHMQGKNSLISKISRDDFEKIIKDSICWMDVIRAMGRTFHGSYYASLIRLAKYYKIDTSHFDTKKALSINNGNTRTNDEIFSKCSNVTRATLKKKIIDDALIEYVCEKCKNTGEWLGTNLVLQLEHKNGVRNDNRLENLCFLCPNCHTQTPTYTGKNNKRDISSVR